MAHRSVVSKGQGTKLAMDDHDHHGDHQEHKHDLFGHVAESTFVVLLCLASLFGNVIVMKTIYCNTRLQNSFNTFVVNLALADVYCALVVMPVTAATLISYETTASKFLCTAHAGFVTLLSIVSLSSMALMAVNRFYLVVKPTQYQHVFSKKRTLKMVACSWVIGFVCSVIIYLVLMPHTQYTLSGVNCFYLRTASIGILTYVLLVLAPSTVTTVGFYLKTHHFIHKLKSSVAPWTRKAGPNHRSHYTEEEKTLKILLLLLVLSYCCLVTSSVVWILQRSFEEFSHDLAVMGIYFQYLKNVVIPLIYTFVSRHFRKEVKKTCSCSCSC